MSTIEAPVERESPAAPPASLSQHCMKMLAIQNQLTTTGLYLGKGCNTADFQWLQDGSGWRVVEKKAVEETKLAHRAFLAGESDVDADPTPDAELSMVVEITPNDCWIAPCARWTESQREIWTFDKIKASFTGGKPDDEVFGVDFESVVKNMTDLIHTAKVIGTGELSKPIVKGRGGEEKVKCRHVIFDKLDHEASPEERDAMKKWPGISEDAKREIAKMVGEYVPIPLQAFDINGQLIKPEDYERKLQGAMVIGKVVLRHWPITGKWKKTADRFVADIARIDVLVSPTPTTSNAVSPSKKRVVEATCEAESSRKTKKTRGKSNP